MYGCQSCKLLDIFLHVSTERKNRWYNLITVPPEGSLKGLFLFDCIIRPYSTSLGQIQREHSKIFLMNYPPVYVDLAHCSPPHNHKTVKTGGSEIFISKPPVGNLFHLGHTDIPAKLTVFLYAVWQADCSHFNTQAV